MLTTQESSALYAHGGHMISTGALGYLPRWYDVMALKGDDVYHAHMNDDSFLQAMLMSDSLAFKQRREQTYEFPLQPRTVTPCALRYKI